MKKQVLRELMKKMCDSMPNEDVKEHSEIIEKIVLNSDEYKNAKSIFIYISFKNEIRTYGIIIDAKKHGKNVYVPKIINGEMKAVSCDFRKLTPNKLGVMEPDVYEMADESKIDLCITPGIVFDRERNRIGFGQGHYDKFLNKNPQIFKLGLAHDIQIVDQITAEEHDVKLHKIITEKRMI